RVFQGVNCDTLTTCVGSNDDFCGLFPELTFAGTASTTYYILIGNYSSASGTGSFPISVFTPTAIHLGNIAAENISGTRNRVTWNSLSEDEGDYYELERSLDGKQFERIQTIPGRNEASSYTVIDENGITGVNYYRLKMIDKSGNAEYSNIVTATVVAKGGFDVVAYPNPAKNNLTVEVRGVQGANAQVQVMDVTGKLIKLVEMDGNQTTIDLQGMASGVYLMKYADDNQTRTIRVTKE